MSGGLLELSAKGYEDMYISNDPQITFFKTVYRRHTNFSIDELDLRFTSKLDFGKESHCKIENYGDLLHHLYLVIKLPEIDIVFRGLTVGEVQTLLKTYDITWTTDKNPNDKFTQDDYNEVEQLVEQKIGDLNNELDTYNKIIASLTTGSFNVITWFTNNPGGSESLYYDDLLVDPDKGFFKYDNYNLTYKIIDAQEKDTTVQLPLINSIGIQASLLRTFIDYATSRDNNVNTHNDDNLEFMYNVDTSNYYVSSGLNNLDANTVFRSGIDKTYGDPLKAYQKYDAYHIFDVTLNNNNITITSNNDVQTIKSILLDNIRYGLVKNVKLQTNIYDSLNNDSRFVFYRKFPVIAPGTYDTNSNWVNQSLSTSTSPDLNDNFTSDFTLPPEPGEPNTVSLPFSVTTNTAVNSFHTTNRDLYNTILFTPYFNDITNLWSYTDVKTNPYTPIITTPYNMYFLNYLWFKMNIDIRASINNYLTAPGLLPPPYNSPRSSGLTPLTIANLDAFLQTIENIIQTTIYPLITEANNYTITNALDLNVKTNSTATGDIVIYAIIRPGINNTIVGLQTIPEYITSTYLVALDTFETTLGGIELINYQTIAKPRLQGIIGLFSTDISVFPSYTTWQTQNQNISSDPVLQINNIVSGVTFYDAQCSIFNYLFKQVVFNYNTLYNQTLLGYFQYKDQNGLELFNYLKTIASTWFGFTPNATSFYDYFRYINLYLTALPVNSGGIGLYLSGTDPFGKLTILNQDFVQYDSNRLLLNMRNILVPRSQFYYEKYLIVLNNIIAIIENNPSLYTHLYHPIPGFDYVLVTQNDIISNITIEQYLIPRNNGIDITTKMIAIAKSFFLSAGTNALPTNPYNPLNDPTKFDLWNQYANTFFKITELNKFTTLFNWLTSSAAAFNLYQYVLQIDVLYNSFASENDVYEFMKDYVLQNSTLKDLPNLRGNTVQNTHDNVLNYYLVKKEGNLLLQDRILGNGDFVPLLTILQRSLREGTPARFAWIKKIGHYLIDKIWFKIDDQLIDTHYGEWLEVWHSLSKTNSKERGYNKLIGNIEELYTFTTRKKKEYQLTIPLQFWFNRYIGHALPLVALNNAELKLYVKLRDLNDVCYYDSFTTFVRKPRLNCNIIGEFIYVENDERQKIVNSKLEYIIDVLQYNGDIFIKKENLSEDITIDILTRFKNPCKEFVWMLQDISMIDGSLENGNKTWDVYDYNGINPIDSVKIKFNRRERETFKDSLFYNYIQPYERHTSSPSTGINTYIFSLNPESYQLSGAVNMSKIDDASIEIKLKEEVLRVLNNDLVNFRLPIYALGNNILRIISGLGGLVFLQ